MASFRAVMPKGCLKARIRISNRECHNPQHGTLEQTLGEEGIGYVMVDPGGKPLQYDALSILSDAVAKQSCRLDLEVTHGAESVWRKSGQSIENRDEHAEVETWRHGVAQGSDSIAKETWVPANDPHYDAKMWPGVHPYGTGSLLSIEGSGGTQRHARNRLMLIQSWFRRTAEWIFWLYSRLIQTELYFKNKRRREAGRKGASAATEEDPIKRLYGVAQPADIPESSEWWKRQQRDLFAMTNESELGLMQCVVTRPNPL